MTRKQRRLSLIASAAVVLAIAVALVLNALRDSIVFFNSPPDLIEKRAKAGQRLRLGGLVKEGTLSRGENLTVRFEITDGTSTVPVVYRGLLPISFWKARASLRKVHSTEPEPLRPTWYLQSTTRATCPRKWPML
jgi:cytochrome c-type biogenesis protein CcmE